MGMMLLDDDYGAVTWGRQTSVLEPNVPPFADEWVGTGVVENSGDTERIKLEAGQQMTSPVWPITGAIEILQNTYDAGDDVTLEYRQGATHAACIAAGWTTYTSSFACDGYVQVRLTSTL